MPVVTNKVEKNGNELIFVVQDDLTLIAPESGVITEVTTAGTYANVAFDKIVPICCCSNASLTIQAVPSVISGATGSEAPVATQIPTIQNANLTITKLS